jgi:hypothetical protein
MEVPMLDEEEFTRVWQHAREGKSELAKVAPFEGPAWKHPVMTTAMQRLLDEYNRITGFGEINANAVWHHRISLYGPPCHSCGKPLRSPQARLCAACGAVREGSDSARLTRA